MKSSARPKAWVSPEADPLLLSSETAQDQFHEQYRRLATALLDRQAGRELRLLVVTSAVASEGKTLTAANLALMLSGSFHKRVLIVDADLRRPRLHTLFRVPRTPGVGDIRSGATAASAYGRALNDGLRVVPAGTPRDPMITLSSPWLAEMLAAARADYDWVIVDTPPIGPVPDAQLVAAQADGVLMVVAAGRPPAALVQRAVDLVGRERVVGTVLNNAAADAADYGYYGYYGYGRYYKPDPD